MAVVTANNQLLGIKEQIQENLSGVQMGKILDELMMNCLRPAITNTDYIEYTIVELLPYIFLNVRRKFSNNPYPELRDGLFSFIMCEDKEEKITLLSKQYLERSVFFAALTIMEKACFEYLEEIEEQLNNLVQGLPYSTEKLDEIKKPFLVHRDFYQTAQSITFWLKKVYQFRSMLVEKYVRSAQIEADKMAKSTELKIDKEDLLRDLILVIFKAIDKYDIRKGPLTSYVNIWFMEAKTNSHNSHEYGVAYQMPTSQRKKMLADGAAQSFTVELNDEIAESLEDETQNMLTNLIKNEDEDLINNISCAADSDKVYCLLNNLFYTPNDEDKLLQMDTMKEESL